jgi:PRTRC genetic system protein B
MPTNPPSPTLPRLRLDFYDEAILMSRYSQTAGQLCTSTHAISAAHLTAACANLRAGSGLLPRDTLFWQQTAQTTTLGIYVPGQRGPVHLKEESLQVPLPPLVFVGQGNQYSVYAVKQRPKDGQARLYHAPCPNVGKNGRICPGNTSFPHCGPETIGDALELFISGSRFNQHEAAGKCHSFPDDVGNLWRHLAAHDKRRFPLSQLVALNRPLAWVIG